MRAIKATKPTWIAIRKHLKDLDPETLLSLIKDLHDFSPGNRDFLQARIFAGEGGGAALESYCKRVIEPFYPPRGVGKLKLGEARKAIREYRKATSDIRGTVELLMIYVENGTRFTRQYGDIDARFYSSLESALDELAALLRDQARDSYHDLSERLSSLALSARYIGWGFGDHIIGVVSDLKDELSSADP
jgi:hypothetical protein